MARNTISLGIDIGSITVKLIVFDHTSRTLLWSGYRRHHAQQTETALRLLAEARAAEDLPADILVAVTGSGAQQTAERGGLFFVQEVNALVRAVRTLHPQAQSVLELGGEDAKMVSIDPLPGGEVNVHPVMNEKCAAGTGSMIDRMIARMGLSAEEAAAIPYIPGVRHPIAAKCGVFAETDLVGLLKNGVAREELLRALFDAVVQQNISTLARGRTPMPRVLLLGGPHRYFPGLVQCWRHRLIEIWCERGIDFAAVGEPVAVPKFALFLPAIGAALECATNCDAKQPAGSIEERLRAAAMLPERKLPSRLAFPSGDERDAFAKAYTPPVFDPPNFSGRSRVYAHLGLDCGSTSVKAVLLDEDGAVLRKDFAFATHDPIADAKDMIQRLQGSVASQGANLEILSLGTTGYAKDILAAVLRADIAVVETVAHKESACRYFPHAGVICDVGGQDIKVMLLQQGGVSDFRLNTQCSAGTGYFLQTVADRFNTTIYRFADEALSAQYAPEFSAGCTIFLQSDIVNFMRAGYTPGEIMAGVLQVLPLNIWIYAARLYDLPAVGEVFVLQGGTQRNLGAVRAQVAYIQDAFKDSGRQPVIRVHPHPAEAGAIGCALLASRKRMETGASGWIGFAALEDLTYRSDQSEKTRCRGCANRCARTVLSVRSSSDATGGSFAGPDEESIIVAPCERGRAASAERQRRLGIRKQTNEQAAPNFARILESAAFSPSRIASELQEVPNFRPSASLPAGIDPEMRICIPRAMNFYACAPLFIAWFLAMGFRPERIAVSQRTTRAMSSTGCARATIDPCFPAKICFAHIDALLRIAAAAKAPAWIFFPAILRLPCAIADPVDSMTCTVAAVIPEAVHAANMLEGDEFGRHNACYLHPFLSLDSLDAFNAGMAECFAPLLRAPRSAFRRAAEIAWEYQERFLSSIRLQARDVLRTLESENRLGIVLLGRPYHADRGLNHGALDALQQMGFPLFTAESLPRDPESLSRLAGDWDGGSVRDVWPNPFSENSSRKIWAAKYAARHPNLLALELSNFKCGHDAPAYSIVRAILQAAGKPVLSFLDLDENTPQNTLNIRLETIRAFLDAWRRAHGFNAIETFSPEALCLQKVS